MVERILGKDEVAGSTPAISSKDYDTVRCFRDQKCEDGSIAVCKNEIVKYISINVNN